MKRRIVTFVALVVGGIAGWAGATYGHYYPAPEPVVTVVDGDEVPLVTRPTRLDIVMVRNDDSLLRCAQMGGRAVDATYEKFTCNGVDF